jgi:CubicO group peptidase (beta-lactamase class C family)
MYDRLDEEFLDRLVSDTVKRKYIHGAVFHIASEDGSLDLSSASGNIGENDRYYIASINKIFVSATVLRMCTEGKLDLNDRLSRYLPEEMMRGLHVHKGKEWSDDLTIAHLISHTSGLPCFLVDRMADGRRVMDELEAGNDQPWPFDKVVREVRGMRTHFPPGSKGKAKYADTNTQILSLLVERVTGRPIQAVLRDLIKDLDMTGTDVIEDADAEDFVPIRYKSEELHIPQFLNSTRNDIVSTAGDQMKFIRAFFDGHFHPKDRLGELETWNNVFFPFRYGLGIQQFHIPRILAPFRPVPDMMGHSGSVGAFTFHVPERKLFITGTTNQQAMPSAAFRAIVKVLNRSG